MPAVTITAQDKTLTDAARTELKSMLENGTTGGGTIAGPFVGITTPSAALDMYQLVMLALIRIFKTVSGNESAAGPAYPARVPQFAKAAMPTASSYTGSCIYVPDEIGGAVVAFSDGTNWRRVTDRAIVS